MLDSLYHWINLRYYIKGKHLLTCHWQTTTFKIWSSNKKPFICVINKNQDFIFGIKCWHQWRKKKWFKFHCQDGSIFPSSVDNANNLQTSYFYSTHPRWINLPLIQQTHSKPQQKICITKVNTIMSLFVQKVQVLTRKLSTSDHTVMVVVGGTQALLTWEPPGLSNLVNSSNPWFVFWWSNDGWLFRVV